MTTYTLEGFAVYYSDEAGGHVGADFTDITLELVVPESTTSLSYELLPPSPDHDNTYVDTALDDYTVRLNGVTIGSDNEFNEGFFAVRWADGGTIRTTILYSAEYLDLTGTGYGDIINPQYLFAIGGDALPSFTTLSQWNDFSDNQLIEAPTPTGAYGEGMDIALSSLGATVTEDDIITGTAGNNTFYGGLGQDTISGLGGNDILNGGKGNDILKGGTGADRLLGKAGKDILRGDSGNDKLLGDAGNDKLFGGDGKDILTGGKGNDLLVGGKGADDFIFQNNSGNDRIKDFNALNNQEDINLAAVTNIKHFMDLKNNHMQKDGNNVVIDDDAGTVITLLNVDLADLGKGDFIF